MSKIGRSANGSANSQYFNEVGAQRLAVLRFNEQLILRVLQKVTKGRRVHANMHTAHVVSHMLNDFKTRHYPSDSYQSRCGEIFVERVSPVDETV